jgi:hypothetical protein
VPFFWTVDHDHIRGTSVTAYRLENGRYRAEITAGPGATVTVTAAPAPVTFDPAELIP